VLPLSPGRAERHGFEYHRHGTLSLYAAFNTCTGEVVGQTSVRRTSDAFLAFLAQVVDTQPRRREIHIILDNLATHKTQKVRTFLAAHPWVHLHFTPAYSSWLNQVELWFADRAGHSRPPHLYLGRGSAPKDPALHSSLQHRRDSLPIAYTDPQSN
jgi:transposase